MIVRKTLVACTVALSLFLPVSASHSGESKPKPQADTQLWTGQVYRHAYSTVRNVEAIGSFKTRSDCDKWVTRYAKKHGYAVESMETMQPGDTTDDAHDAIKYSGPYWVAFCHRTR